MSDSIKAYILMGLKRCGKTTQGKIVAEKVGIPFVDTDALVEQIAQMPTKEIYKRKGPGAFAMAEEEACQQIEKQYSGKSVIVSAGGGICDNPPALYALRSVGSFVFINLDINFAVSRVEDKIVMIKPGYFENAPSYVLSRCPSNMKEVHEIIFQKFQDRINQYLHIADIIVNVKNDSVEEITNQLMSSLF